MATAPVAGRFEGHAAHGMPAGPVPPFIVAINPHNPRSDRQPSGIMCRDGVMLGIPESVEADGQCHVESFIPAHLTSMYSLLCPYWHRVEPRADV
jgi:hypothetical protein